MRLGINKERSNYKAVYEGYESQRALWQSRGIAIQRGSSAKQAPQPYDLDRLRIYADIPRDQHPNTETAEGCFEIFERIGEELRRIEREFPDVISEDQQ